VGEDLTAQAIYDHTALGAAAMEDVSINKGSAQNLLTDPHTLQYESSGSDSSSSGEDSEVETEPSGAVRPMLYNYKVNIDYIRARIRLHKATKVRPINLNGEKLADVEAAGALQSELKASG
jgi:hypothetical protein